jgi:hypothetical protein
MVLIARLRIMKNKLASVFEPKIAEGIFDAMATGLTTSMSVRRGE